MLTKMGYSFSNSIKKCDIYGVPVSLNFKGEDKFRTVIGGLTTLVISVLIFWYTIVQVQVILDRGRNLVKLIG